MAEGRQPNKGEADDDATRAAGSDHRTLRLLGGKPTTRNMRIALDRVLGMLAAGGTAETILHVYPVLGPENIHVCLLFPHRSTAGERVHERIPIQDV